MTTNLTEAQEAARELLTKVGDNKFLAIGTDLPSGCYMLNTVGSSHDPFAVGYYCEETGRFSGKLYLIIGNPESVNGRLYYYPTLSMDGLNVNPDGFELRFGLCTNIPCNLVGAAHFSFNNIIKLNDTCSLNYQRCAPEESFTMDTLSLFQSPATKPQVQPQSPKQKPKPDRAKLAEAQHILRHFTTQKTTMTNTQLDYLHIIEAAKNQHVSTSSANKIAKAVREVWSKSPPPPTWGGSQENIKVFYKGYYYKVRVEGKRQHINTKHEGRVSLTIVRKWQKNSTKTKK